MRNRFIKALIQGDVSYLLICVVLSALSVLTLFSVGIYGGLELGGTLGNMKPALTQLAASGIGIVCAVLISKIDYHILIRFWPVICAVSWGLVLLTFIPGVGYAPEGTGSQSWIALPFGMSFQPTEIAKVGSIISFAGHLVKVGDRLYHPLVLLPVLGHLLLPVLVIHVQGDDGTALVFLFIGIIMLIMAGINRWAVVGCAVAAAIATPLIWTYVMPDYQKDRIIGLFDPAPYADSIMYQQLAAREAIGAGSLLGVGLVSEHHFVPRAENDFLFSYYAESFGLVGGVILLALLGALLFKTMFAGLRAPDGAGAFICVGVFGALMFQSVVNIGMNLMLFPVMGITLPFLSAGGSSVLMMYISAGLVMGVLRRTSAGRPTKLTNSAALLQ